MCMLSSECCESKKVLREKIFNYSTYCRHDLVVYGDCTVRPVPPSARSIWTGRIDIRSARWADRGTFSKGEIMWTWINGCKY